LTVTAWWASGGEAIRLRGRNWLIWSLRVGLVLAVLLGISGAITALGDTLYPANTLREGLQQDFAIATNVLIRLRVFHPLIAIGVGVYLVVVSRLLRAQETTPTVDRLARGLEIVIIVQLAAGFLNVFLLAPVWMQLVHLLLADLVWIVLVLLSASVTAVPVPRYTAATQQA
jgi:heme A synthase